MGTRTAVTGTRGADAALFADRDDAGARLGGELRGRAWHEPVVVGLPRGGVPVAARVAAALGAPLDVVVVRKVGAPGRPEHGVGAVTASGRVLFDESALARLGLSPEDLRDAVAAEREADARRLAGCRELVAPVAVTGRDVVVVDDGLATGVTARAAVHELAAGGPRRLVLVAPVGSVAGRAALLAEPVVDDVVCLAVPSPFGAVSRWYDDFRPVEEGEVHAALAAAVR